MVLLQEKAEEDFAENQSECASSFAAGNQHQNLWCVPEESFQRITSGRENAQTCSRLLEGVHQCILGADCTVIFPDEGGDPAMVSFEDLGVLKKFIQNILNITHFKTALTSIYIIGDLVTHSESEGIQRNTAKVLPLVFTAILDKLGDSKVVIRQTVLKLLAKTFCMSNIDRVQLVYLVFENLENSAADVAKCEALVTALIVAVLGSKMGGQQDQGLGLSDAAELSTLVASQLWKWFA